MCRLAAYIGEPILLDELLYRPRNSLILQSYKAKEREEPLNGDGFGVGWYNADNLLNPVVFRSITPAWSNQNLQNIAKNTRSHLFFAHIRASTHGTPVMEVNCHPFSAGRLLWMHNGQIGGFPAIKRKLVNLVSEERYRGIQGSTDTEHALALFLDALPDPTQAVAPDQIRRGLFTMIECLTKLTRDNHIDETSYLNICVTNGEDVVAMRYVSEKAEKAHSLYWSEEGQYVTLDGVPHLVDTVSSERGVIVSSEKLTEREKDWNPIPQNHLVVIRKDLSVKVEEIGR